MENTRCTHEDISGKYNIEHDWAEVQINSISMCELDPNYSRYYCVITQVDGAWIGACMKRITQLLALISLVCQTCQHSENVELLPRLEKQGD